MKSETIKKNEWIVRFVGKNLLVSMLTLALMIVPLTPSFSQAGQPWIIDIDIEFVDEDSFGYPVLIRSTGRLIERFGEDYWSFIQPVRFEYTNLSNGKTVETQVAGFVTGYYDGRREQRGTVFIRANQDHGPWVKAGIVETIIEFDPETGEITEIALRSVGRHPGHIADEIAARLE